MPPRAAAWSFDNELVSLALFRLLLGAIWGISGALMIWNPPPPEVDGTEELLIIGWVTLVAGTWFSANALRGGGDVEDSGRPPRHALGTSFGDAVKLGAAYVVLAVMGVGMLWWAIDSRLLSLLGLAGAVVGPWVLLTLNWMLRRVLR